MGTYIKGMDIEEDHACVRCRLSTKTAFDKLPFCDVTMKDIEDWSKRPDWCPLVPISAHGRLIDADEFKLYLAKMLIKYAPAFKTDEYAHFAVQLTEAIASDIDEAPTIIEAEEGKA